MKRSFFSLSIMVAAVAWSALAAQDSAPPPCEPGFTYKRVTEYKDVETYVCKLVPYVKKTKKWVYYCKDAPFCIHKSKSGLLCLVDNPTCMGPFSRSLLVKKEIVVKEEPATRCVVEKVVKQVPCLVWRKVPISATVGIAAPSPSQPLPIKK